ncbi:MULTISPECIES: phage tail protein [unclassified Ensifer]|uniref:phage tail protein n=1 Tax=unclassified Ensifer TaxID=2633371 RepID=UPI00300FA24F
MRSDEIAQLLPQLYRDTLRMGGVLDAILAVIEHLHAPIEDRIARFDAFLDPRRAPDGLVELMARWLALEPYLDNGRPEQRGRAVRPGALRDLVAYAAEAARSRGTSGAIIGMLERATAVPGFGIEENPAQADGQPRPFHIRVRVPASAGDQIDLVRRIVSVERPAFVTFELTVEQA